MTRAHCLAQLGLLASLLLGCSDRTLEAVTRGPEPTPAHCAPLPTEPIARSWESSALTILTSELSPAVLLHSSRSTLRLFAELSRWGLGAPTHVAFGTASGVRVLTAGAGVDVPVGELSEAWLLVWFAGAEGFSWDAPWLVTLQHRPEAARLDADGLALSGSAALGYVGMLPLYGLAKPDTSGWDALPNEVLQQARFWTRALRRYPLAVTDRFRLESDGIGLQVHHQFTLLESEDDFGTVPLELAPLSPSLGLAYLGGRMPMSVSDPVTDTSIVTGHGPYLAVESSTCHEVRFDVMDYVNRGLASPSTAQEDPRALAALTDLQAAATLAFTRDDGLFHQDFGDPQDFASAPPQLEDDPSVTDNTCWASIAALYYPRALPYLEPDARSDASARLRRYVDEWLLQEQRFTPLEDKLQLDGPGLEATGDYGRAAARANSLLPTLYSYAQHTQDFELLTQRWPLIERLFSMGRSMSFRSFGRERIPELGDQAAPALAMARTAYFTGHLEQYAYASYLFARELTLHVVKHTAAQYFLDHQPLREGPAPSGVIYPTQQLGGLSGWELDGPEYPADAVDKNFIYRWIRFNDPDVGRFHRDHLLDLDQTELHADSTVQSWIWVAEDGTQSVEPWHDDPHIRPSLKRLRATVLGETLDELEDIQVPEGQSIFPESAVIASALALLQAGAPPEVESLITPFGTDYALGIAREGREHEAVLAVGVDYLDSGAPVLYWSGWTPPTPPGDAPAASAWSFGAVNVDSELAHSGSQRVSPSTLALTFD